MQDLEGEEIVFKKIYFAMKVVILFPTITSLFDWRRGDVSEKTKCKILSDLWENTEFTFCFCFG